MINDKNIEKEYRIVRTKYQKLFAGPEGSHLSESEIKLYNELRPKLHALNVLKDLIKNYNSNIFIND